MEDAKLKKADILFRKKQFQNLIKELEPYVMEYRQSADFFYMLGVSNLYLGILGAAEDYLTTASRIDSDSPKSLIALGALFLRKGSTTEAISCYLEAQEIDPQNALVKKSLNFIRKSDMATISQAVDNGKITEFYPSTGVYIPVQQIVAVAAAVVVITVTTVVAINIHKKAPKRADLSNYTLTVNEKNNPVESDGGTYRYIMTTSEINDSYNKALKYFQDFKDNQAQVEINRILNSNASLSIKQKARDIMNYITEPGFENIKDVYSYKKVEQDPYLYMDCWVVWSGRVSNVEITETTYNCEFLVGYDDMKNVDGIVPCSIPLPISIDVENPVQILGKLTVKNNKLFLLGKSVYQPLGKK